MFAFLAIARQMNFQRIIAMMKGYAKNVSRIRFEIRAKLHTGFRDYSESKDSEESHQYKLRIPKITQLFFFILIFSEN